MSETWNLFRAFGAFFFIFWTAFNTALVDVVGSEQQIPLSVVKLWASAFGGEIKSIAAKYSGSQLLQKLSIKEPLAIYYEPLGDKSQHIFLKSKVQILLSKTVLLLILLDEFILCSQIKHC